MSSSPPVVLRRRRPQCPSTASSTETSAVGNDGDVATGWCDDSLPALRHNCRIRRSWFGGNCASSGTDEAAHLYSTLSSVTSSAAPPSSSSSSRLSFIADKLSVTSLSRRHHHHMPLTSSLSCSSTTSTTAGNNASGAAGCVCGSAKSADKSCAACISQTQHHVLAERALSTVATVIQGVDEAITADKQLCEQLRAFLSAHESTSSSSSPAPNPPTSPTTSQASSTPPCDDTTAISPQHTDEPEEETAADSVVVCCRCCAVPRLHSAEARLTQLERHLAELHRIREACHRQQRMLAGAERLTAAFTLAGGQKHQGLSQSRASLRQCSDTMNSIYTDLEANLGTIRIEIDELLGFARLCAGDVYDVVVRMSGAAVWRTRVTVGNSYTGSGSGSSWWYVPDAPVTGTNQTWSSRCCSLRPALHHRMVVKLREVRGLTRRLAGTGIVDIAELFRLNTQRLLLCLNTAGTLRLCMKVTWSPLGDGSSDRQYVSSHHGCTCVMKTSSTLSSVGSVSTSTASGNGGRSAGATSGSNSAEAEITQPLSQSDEHAPIGAELSRDSSTVSFLSSVSTQLSSAGDPGDYDQAAQLTSTGTMASCSSGDSSSNRSPRDSSISSIDSCHKLSQYWLLQQNHHLDHHSSISLSPHVARPSVSDYDTGECADQLDNIGAGYTLSSGPPADLPAPVEAVKLDSSWSLSVRVAWSCYRLQALINDYIKQQEGRGDCSVGSVNDSDTGAVSGMKHAYSKVIQSSSGDNVPPVLEDLRTLLRLIGLLASRAPPISFSSSSTLISDSQCSAAPNQRLPSSDHTPMLSTFPSDLGASSISAASDIRPSSVSAPSSSSVSDVVDGDGDRFTSCTDDVFSSEPQAENTTVFNEDKMLAPPDHSSSERSDDTATERRHSVDDGDKMCVVGDCVFDEDETEDNDDLEQQSQSSDASVESALDKFNFLLTHSKDDVDTSITGGTNDSGIASIIHTLDNPSAPATLAIPPLTEPVDTPDDDGKQTVCLLPSSEQSDNSQAVSSTLSEHIPVDVCLDVHLLNCVRLAQRLKCTGPLCAVSSLSAAKLCRQRSVLQLIVTPEITAEQILTDRQLLHAWYSICGDEFGTHCAAPLYLPASVAVDRLSLALKPRLSHRDDNLANKVGRQLVNRCLDLDQTTSKSLLTVFAFNSLFSGSTFDRVIEELSEEVEFSNCLLSHNAHSIGRRLSQMVYMVPPVHCMVHVCRLMYSASTAVTDTITNWLRDLATVSFVVQKLVPVFFELLESDSSAERVGALLILHRLQQASCKPVAADVKLCDEAAAAANSWCEQLKTAAQYLLATDPVDSVKVAASTVLHAVATVEPQ